MPESDNAPMYDATIRVRDLPRTAWKIIELIARTRNCNKWEVTRDAIMEYAENHKQEVKEFVA